MTPAERAELIERYAAGPTLLDAALAQMPAAMWTYRPAPDAWSVHEIVVHLADSEANAALRCRLLVAQPGHTLMAYDQDVWARELDYHSRDPDLALDVVRAVRASSAALLRNLPEQVWTHTIVHAEYDRPYTFDDWLQVYAAHIPDHIDQMRANLAAWRTSGGA